VQAGITTVIEVPVEEIEARRALFRIARSGHPPPRWPVSVRCSDIHNAEIHGVGRAEYLNDPVTHAEAQIAGRKWMLENIETDASHVVVCPLLAAGPSAFGAKIVARPAGRAWIEPWISNRQHLEKLQKIDPNNTGVNAEYDRWCEIYEEIAEQYPVRFRGGDEFFPLSGQTRPLTTGATGPFSLAVELMGKDRLLGRLEVDPIFVEDLLEILTQMIIDTLTQNREEEKYRGTIFLSCPNAGLLNEEQYRQLALPCLLEIKNQLRSPVTLYQSDLPADHVEPILTELQPESICGFHFRDNLLESFADIAFTVEGRCRLEPGLDSRSLATLSEEELFDDTVRTITVFDKYGNFSLSASAPDAMELADLPKLNAIKRASISMRKREE